MSLAPKSPYKALGAALDAEQRVVHLRAAAGRQGGRGRRRRAVGVLEAVLGVAADDIGVGLHGEAAERVGVVDAGFPNVLEIVVYGVLGDDRGIDLTHRRQD